MEKNIKDLIEVQKKNRLTDTQIGAMVGVCAGTIHRWKLEKTHPTSSSHRDGIKRFLKEYSNI